MRIGIDFYYFDPDYSGGVTTFALGITKGLLSAVQQSGSVAIIASEKNEKYLKSLLEGLPVTFITVSVKPWYRYINRMIWVLSWATRNFKLRFWYDKYFRASTMKMIDSSIDALVVPITLLSFYGLKASSILCIHDIQQEYHPELFSFGNRVRRWAPYRLSCWKADAIQASSKYIKDCLVEKFEFINPGKVFIAHEGVDLDKFSVAIQAERPENIATLEANSFVFYPAQLWPHKNHVLLIEALSIFRKKMGYELPCVLTGHDYGHLKSIQDIVAGHQLKSVHYLGRISFTQLLWLYRNCKAVLALGLHESSSLPVREGAVFGKPLICADIPPNIETQEFLHLKIVDRANPDDLAGTFIELIENADTIFADSSKNAELVKIFDWNNIAKKYLSVLNDLVQERELASQAKE